MFLTWHVQAARHPAETSNNANAISPMCCRNFRLPALPALLVLLKSMRHLCVCALLEQLQFSEQEHHHAVLHGLLNHGCQLFVATLLPFCGLVEVGFSSGYSVLAVAACVFDFGCGCVRGLVGMAGVVGAVLLARACRQRAEFFQSPMLGPRSG